MDARVVDRDGEGCRPGAASATIAAAAAASAAYCPLGRCRQRRTTVRIRAYGSMIARNGEATPPRRFDGPRPSDGEGCLELPMGCALVLLVLRWAAQRGGLHHPRGGYQFRVLRPPGGAHGPQLRAGRGLRARYRD